MAAVERAKRRRVRKRSCARPTGAIRGRCGSASGAAPTRSPRRSTTCARRARRPNSKRSSPGCASTRSRTRTTRARGSAASSRRSSTSSSPRTPNGEEYARATWTGISGDAYYRNGDGRRRDDRDNEWLDANVRARDPREALPKFAFIMEGDTPAFLGLTATAWPAAAARAGAAGVAATSTASRTARRGRSGRRAAISSRA